VYRVARLDGMSVLFVAGLFAVLAALAGDFVGAIVGLLVAGAGALELHGAALLKQGETRGVNWLVGSQLSLLVTILVYCVVRWFHFELPPIPADMKPLLQNAADQLDVPVETYLRLLYHIVLWAVALVSIIYQGGMALYYLRRRGAIIRALAS